MTVPTAWATRIAALALPVNAIVSAPVAEPDLDNSEIIRITAAVGGTGVLTIARAQEGSTARAILAGDRIRIGVTGKVLTDIEAMALHGNPTICQGRLALASSVAATTLYFVPCNGNVVFWNNTLLTLFGYSCSISNAGLSANTLYYVYLYSNGGSPALELSTTVPTSLVSGGEQGVRCKSTGSGTGIDLTRLLVGMVYTDAASKFNADPGSVNPGKMNVISWFNQMRILVAGFGGFVAATTSAHDHAGDLPANYANLAPAVNNNFEFLTWGPLLGLSPSFVIGISGCASLDKASAVGDMRFGTLEDGFISSTMAFNSPGINYLVPCSGSSTMGLPQGHHTFALYGRVDAASGAVLSVYVNSFGETNG